MKNGRSERLDRIEANLDRVTAVLVLASKRQSVGEERQNRTDEQLRALAASMQEAEDDIRVLLKAQVLLTESQRSAQNQMAAVAESQRVMVEKVTVLADTQAVLLHTVGEMIRGKDRPSA